MLNTRSKGMNIWCLMILSVIGFDTEICQEIMNLIVNLIMHLIRILSTAQLYANMQIRNINVDSCYVAYSKVAFLWFISLIVTDFATAGFQSSNQIQVLFQLLRTFSQYLLINWETICVSEFVFTSIIQKYVVNKLWFQWMVKIQHEVCEKLLILIT